MKKFCKNCTHLKTWVKYEGFVKSEYSPEWTHEITRNTNELGYPKTNEDVYCCNWMECQDIEKDFCSHFKPKNVEATLTAKPSDVITGQCSNCVFVAAKCAESGIKDCPYFAKQEV